MQEHVKWDGKHRCPNIYNHSVYIYIYIISIYLKRERNCKKHEILYIYIYTYMPSKYTRAIYNVTWIIQLQKPWHPTNQKTDQWWSSIHFPSRSLSNLIPPVLSPPAVPHGPTCGDNAAVFVSCGLCGAPEVLQLRGEAWKQGTGGYLRQNLRASLYLPNIHIFRPKTNPATMMVCQVALFFSQVLPVSSLCWSSAFLRNDVLSKYDELQWLKCGKSPKIPGEFMIQGASSWASSILPMFPGCRTRRTRRVHMDRLHFFQGTTWQFSRGPPYLKEGNSDPKLLNLSIYIYIYERSYKS